MSHSPFNCRCVKCNNLWNGKKPLDVPGLRTKVEMANDAKWEAHLNGECLEDCPWCEFKQEQEEGDK